MSVKTLSSGVIFSGSVPPSPMTAAFRKPSSRVAMEARVTPAFGSKEKAETPGMMPAPDRALTAHCASRDSPPMSRKPCSRGLAGNTMPAALAPRAKNRAICQREMVSPVEKRVAVRPLVIP